MDNKKFIEEYGEDLFIQHYLGDCKTNCNYKCYDCKFIEECLEEAKDAKFGYECFEDIVSEAYGSVDAFWECNGI